jgi:membrane fusion protein, multidrug efflux system
MQSQLSPPLSPAVPEITAPSGNVARRPRRPLRERLRRPLLFGFPILLALAGAAEYVAQAPYVSTDDAFVRVAKEQINARVAGQVVQIAVRDNQRVQQGQVLFRLDPAPYQIAVAQAQARLDSARLAIAGLKASYREQQAELRAAEDTVAFDARDYARDDALATADDTPRVVFDHAETDLKVAEQHVVSVEQQIAQTVAALDGDPDIVVDSHPTVRAAAAALDRARLDLSYATVTAPESGTVTGVDDLQLGDFVDPGATAFWLLSDHRIWIEANFRETDLTHMRAGEPATITVDAYPGRVFAAHVVSMSPGTGSDFAVLPPENATGNWVKVVQRLPVRLEFNDTSAVLALFSGLSVTARIDTGHRAGWPTLDRLLSAEFGR